MFMFNLFLKYFIMINLIIFNILSLSLTDLMIIWFFMEVSNFMFICYSCFFINNKKMIFFYYMIQIIPSLLLIIYFLMNTIYLTMNNLYIIFLFSLLMKLGVPPFHFWMPIYCISIPWNTIFIMLTIQKLIPFYMLNFLTMNYLMLFIIIMLCSLIPPLMLMTTTNFKKIIPYSSINQSSWLILLINMKSYIWFIYFIFYSSSLLSLIMLINNFNIKFNYYNKKYFLSKNYFNYMFLLIMLNLASFPPFSMFFLKCYSTFMLIMNSKMLLMIMIMLLSSFFMLFIYLNMIFLSMYFNFLTYKFLNFNNSINYNNSYLMIYLFLIMLSSLMLLIL